MTSNRGAVELWSSVGSSETSPVDNKIRARVSIDQYYVVVGFEVNKPGAFKDNIHDLAVDYGHAFFYLVRNLTIKSSLSFGPAGMGKFGWFDEGKVMTSKKDGSQNARPATADFGITEHVRAFKIRVSKGQATALEQEIQEIRREIQRGSVQYSALVNDTCAETAKEVLDDANVETPGGSSWVKHSRMMGFPFVYAVNPYKWHKNFKGAHSEVIFKPNTEGEWIPVAGDSDPIFGTKS